CMAPELIYWAFLGGAADVEPVKWGFSFTPWVCAWLVSLIMAALVLGIGHFTRYRPGLVWIFTLVFLIAAVVLFEAAIGFVELDYQLYVARNNPEKAAEFHDHSITEALDKRLTDPAVRKYLAGFFYPTEPIALRGELKNEIQIQLSQGRWPSWFMVPKELDFEAKRRWLAERYELFIRRRPKSNRMPIALYYKAILNEYRPDINVLGQKEILHFYSDYPHESAREIWYRLYRDFGDSPESLEGRIRIARHWAGQGRFSKAGELVDEAQAMVTVRLKLLRQETTVDENLFGLFRSPAASAITEFELEEIQRKLDQLQILISGENHTEAASTGKRLAKFVMLNPHSGAFAFELNELLGQMEQIDPLRDNVLLAQIKLVADEQLRAEKLGELYAKFPNTDGGIEAMYELGLLEIYLWRQQGDLNPEQKKKYLSKTRATLARFIELYPESIFAEQVKKNLEGLPGVE
ncbi:MAG: tetratricopeptide repeat protein, partial [Planctomycetota bacterium]